MALKLRFRESRINSWAKTYAENQGEKYRARESEVIGLREDIQRRGYLTKSGDCEPK